MSAVNIERILVVTLSGLSLSVFLSQTGIDICGLLSLLLLSYWRFVLGYKPEKDLPKPLVVITFVFLLNLFVSAAFSDDQREGLRELQKYWNVLLVGMLFTCPISDRSRKRIVLVFFLGAIAAGLVGGFQYYGIFFKTAEGAHGFTHHIHYAGNLAFAFISSMILLAIPPGFSLEPKRMRVVIVLAILTTSGGILFSQARGVWIAVFVSSVIVLLVYNRRIAFMVAVLMVSLSLVIFAFSGTLRQRAASIVTSVYSEDERGSTGNRLELWKGALMLFKESPLRGRGLGSFEPDMNKLIAEGKIKQVPITTHAHNIFLQTMATQGIVGLAVMLAFFVILFSWGLKEIRCHGNTGGYVIIGSTLLTLIGGLTENNIEISKFFAGYCLTIGLVGAYNPIIGRGHGSL